MPIPACGSNGCAPMFPGWGHEGCAIPGSRFGGGNLGRVADLSANKPFLHAGPVNAWGSASFTCKDGTCGPSPCGWRGRERGVFCRLPRNDEIRFPRCGQHSAGSAAGAPPPLGPRRTFFRSGPQTRFRCLCAAVWRQRRTALDWRGWVSGAPHDRPRRFSPYRRLTHD